MFQVSSTPTFVKIKSHEGAQETFFISYWPKIFINGPLGQVGCLEVYLYLSSRELSVNTGLASCSQYILLSIYIFVTIINECQKVPNNGCHTVGNFNDEFASHSHFGAQKSFYYCSHCFMSILMLVNCCK